LNYYPEKDRITAIKIHRLFISGTKSGEIMQCDLIF